MGSVNPTRLKHLDRHEKPLSYATGQVRDPGSLVCIVETILTDLTESLHTDRRTTLRRPVGTGSPPPLTITPRGLESPTPV